MRPFNISFPDYVTPEEYKALLDKHGLKYLCVGAKFQAMSENPQAIQDAIKLSDLFETDYIDMDALACGKQKECGRL